MDKLKDGYIFDYISGEQVKATPEEIDAVQVFSKILVEDYGYPKDVIQTRPQWRVKSKPSDKKKEYPVDIAVFNSLDKNEDTISIIVECKKKNVTDGQNQLEDYLRFSKAQIGVWYNGNNRLFIRKYEKAGTISFHEIPDIPKFGQRLEDVGLFKRKDLKPATNLKSIFKIMRNYLAGNVVGATRDEVLAQQLINLIFCKIYDEKFTRPDDMVNFRVGIDEPHEDVVNRIYTLFNEVKEQYNDVVDFADSITLDNNSIVYVVGILQRYSLLQASRDAIGAAFEIFIDHALKGGQGQFFTPRNVVKMIVEMIQPSTTDKIIDPACGSGGFLVESLRYVWNKVELEKKALNWPEAEIAIEKQRVAIRNFRGLDKDSFLAKVAKAYMAILGDGRGGVFCENSLDRPENWQHKTQEMISLGSFDIVITNPPFGSKIKIDGEQILKQYDFAYKWSINKENNKWQKGNLNKNETPQILFIERCLQFLKPGGKLGIVLPDGILGNEKLGYIREYLLDKCRILAIVDLPLTTFMPYTSTKTSVIILKKLEDNETITDYPIFMAIANECGHDRRGNETEIDDIENIPKQFKEWKAKYNVN